MNEYIKLNKHDCNNLAPLNSLSKKMVFVLIGIICTLVTLLGSFNISQNKYQFLLPISYTIAYMLLAPSISKLGLGYIVLNIVWIIRYCFLPVMTVFTNYSIFQIDEKHLIIALFLMFIELWISFIALRYYYSKFKKRSHYKTKNLNKENLTLKNIKPRLIIVFIFLSLFIILMDRNALSGYNFILNEDFIRRGNPNFGSSVLIINWTKYLTTVYLIGLFGKKYEVNKSFANIIFAILIMLISISFFHGTSRNGILIESAAYIFLLIRFFPKHSKKIIIICGGTLVFILLNITMYRFYDTHNISEAIGIYNLENLTELLNEYFAGQYNVAIGVKTLDLFWDRYGVLTILKDLLANTILVNRLVSNIPGTVYFFNYTFYGHTLWADKISPTITQAMGLFNIFGVFIPVLIIYLIVKMDFVSKTEEYGLGIFVATLFAVNLAFYSPGNITIIATSITNKLLPLYLIYKATSYKFRRGLIEE